MASAHAGDQRGDESLPRSRCRVASSDCHQRGEIVDQGMRRWRWARAGHRAESAAPSRSIPTSTSKTMPSSSGNTMSRAALHAASSKRGCHARLAFREAQADSRSRGPAGKRDLGCDAAGPGRHHQHAVGKIAAFHHAVGDEDHGDAVFARTASADRHSGSGGWARPARRKARPSAAACGCAASARAIETRIFMPPDNSRG